jgi:tyrosinase
MMAKYVVQTGDTLAAIANRFGVGLSALKAANPQVANPDRIFPGQVVTIPGSFPAAGSDYVVQTGDTLIAIANRFGVSVAALKAANPQISNPDSIFPGQIITVMSVITYVRHNIWTLDQIDHWHPMIYAYARAVRVLMDRSNVNRLDPIGWQYQSDVHGTAVSPDHS